MPLQPDNGARRDVAEDYNMSRLSPDTQAVESVRYVLYVCLPHSGLPKLWLPLLNGCLVTLVDLDVGTPFY